MILKTVGRYVLQGKVGSGQYGDVYLAHDPVLKREVAIKIPSFDIQQHDLKKLLKTFQKEAEITARFLHPNIVAVYDVGSNKIPSSRRGEDYWPHYLVMEFVDGTDLKSVLKKQGRLSVQQTLDVVYHCCMALDYVHYLGVVHRDVKPGNVLVNWDKGIFKLTDFGIADDAMRESDRSMGSLCYMSPEHFDKNVSVDHRTDIYALGCMMYELLTGHSAFRGCSVQDVVEQVKNRDIASVSEQVEGIPLGLDKIIQRACSKNPDDRFDDALAFARALKEIGDDESDSRKDVASTSQSRAEQYLDLREDSWFHQFTPDQISELLAVAARHEYAAGDFIIRESEEANAFYILVAGQVVVEKSGQHLLSMEPGESFGETGIRALENRRRTADVRAETEATVLSVDIDKIELLSNSTRAALYRVFLEASMKRLSRITSEVVDLRSRV